MQQYNKTKGVRGIVSLYHDALRFRDMITPQAEERVRILAFWQKHGDSATKEAFKVSRATLFRWQKALRSGGGKIESLVPGSTAPKMRRRRVIPDSVKELIMRERLREKIGKEKLARLLRDDGITTLSASTVGRMLGDLKRNGALSNSARVTLNGRTGNLIERKLKQYRKKLRSKGHAGALVVGEGDGHERAGDEPDRQPRPAPRSEPRGYRSRTYRRITARSLQITFSRSVTMKALSISTPIRDPRR